MKTRVSIITACLAAFILAPTAEPDNVRLRTGQTLTGDILAEKNDHIFLDVGIDILKIQKTDIADFNYDEPNQPEHPNSTQIENLQTAPKKAKIPGDKLYYSADLPKKSIEQAVEDVSEAVVKVSSPAGTGSGFFLNENAYLITNYHVIEKETEIEVTVFHKAPDGFEKRKFKKVKIVAINPFVDLALLQVRDINDIEIKYAHLGDINDIAVGQTVFAIGNPLGLERTVTDGVISTKNRSFQGLVYIQTNADINPGNSGGPLFNLAGEVVGVTNMGYIFFGGLGFAIPIDYVKHFIENRDAFAYDKDNPNTGYRYLQPDSRKIKSDPKFLRKPSTEENK